MAYEFEGVLLQRRRGRTAALLGAVLLVLPLLGLGLPLGIATPLFAVGLLAGGLFLNERATRELADLESTAEDLGVVLQQRQGDTAEAFRLFYAFLVGLMLLIAVQAIFF